MKELLPFQVRGVQLMHKFEGRALLADSMGLGKAQPLSAWVLTPEGFKPIGSILPGMEVIGGDGKPTKVLSIHPQGNKRVYEVHFNDGSETECCMDHLWHVTSPYQRHKGLSGSIKSLREIRGDLKDKYGNHKWFIPMVSPVEYPKKKVPIHPYVMGYLLANGCFRYGSIIVSIPHKETVHRIGKRLPKGTKLKWINDIDYRIVSETPKFNPVMRALKEMDMVGRYSYQKEIPTIYMENSVKTRHLLLQGYLDGDGWVSSNTIGCSSSSEALHCNIRDLVRSLGGVARRSVKKFPRFIYKNETKTGRPAYMLTINLPEQLLPFKLSLKAELYYGHKKYKPTRAITKIKPSGTAKCVCIKVANEDGLYVTDDFIVTHNTLQIISYIEAHPDMRPIIIVCPAIAKYHWEAEFRSQMNLHVQILDGQKPLQRLPIVVPQVIIINYDILKYWLPYLWQLNAQIVVADEIHKCKNRSAGRTKALKELCRGMPTEDRKKRIAVPHVIGATGSAIVSYPVDLWSILNIIRPELFPKFSDYVNRYCSPKKTYWGWQYRGAENTEELHKILIKNVMIRRRKPDVIKDLPNKNRDIIPFTLNDIREYKTMEDSFRNWTVKLSQINGKLKKKLKSKTLGKLGNMIRWTSHSKLPQVMEWVDDFLESEGEKIILFCIHKKIIHRLKEHFGNSCVAIDGDTSKENRKKYIDRFNNEESCKVMIGQIIAAGTVWSAKSCCNVGLIEFGFTPGDIIQAEDRVHGIGRGREKNGKKLPVSIYYFVAKGTVDERLCRLNQQKQEQNDSILDGGKSSGFNLFDRLIQEISSEAKQKSNIIPS